MILAKGQKAKNLETIIEKVLSDPQIFVFSEFIDLVNEQAVSFFNELNFRLTQK